MRAASALPARNSLVRDQFPTAGGWGKEWFDGQIRKLRAGVEFHSKASTFRGNASYQASKRGGRARIRHLANESPEAIVLQFIPKN